MTRLTKRVERETDARGWRGKRNLIVALLPGDVIEIREKGTRKRWEDAEPVARTAYVLLTNPWML